MLVKLCVAFAFMLTLAAVDLARAQQRCYIQCDADYAASRQSGQRQGPQGKRGPVGHSGSKGDKGEAGEAYTDTGELERLKKKCEQLSNVTSTTARKLAVTEDRLAFVEELLAEAAMLPVGISNRNVIKDSQLTSSSSYSPAHTALRGRLYSTTGSGGWVVARGHNRVGEWIQVDLGVAMQLVGVATQGSHTAPQWVTSYQVHYKLLDSDSFVAVKDFSSNIINFPGNSDRDTVVKHRFPAPFPARFVRIYPQTYHGYTFMRFELYKR